MQPVLTPATPLAPPALTAEAVQERILAAALARTPLDVLGNGTKRAYGRAVQAEPLRLAGLAGVVDYQPQELILVLRPGTLLADVERLLEGHGQMLAFEPPHWGDGATIGGAVGCNLAGPRRFKAGAARDHLLGFQAVTGRGELVRGGGRVVKNVTGYDLSKLLCGSFGTLAVFTELCLKVLPRPETEATVVFTGLAAAQALDLLRDLAGSQVDASGLACLAPGVTMPPSLLGLTGHPHTVALARVEGPEASVAQRARLVAEAGPASSIVLQRVNSRGLWRNLKELQALPLRAGERLWRVAVPPTAAAGLLESLRAPLPRAAPAETPLRAWCDWAGGLVWLALPAEADARVHPAAQAAGGHARLVRSTAPVAATLQAFAPLAPAVLEVQRALKAQFDPAGILNPGRMHAEL